MEELLFSIKMTPQIIYLSLILVIIGKALKDASFIENWSIIWILMTISIIVSFVFHGFNFQSFFEAVIATSLATTIYQAYKQARKGIMHFKGI